MGHGKLVISLDFEMMWGVRDHRSIATYGENVAAVRKVVPRLIDMADEMGIHLTFGVVGMMMLSGRDALVEFFPTSKPTYTNAVLSPYGDYIEKMTEQEESYHFAPDLIELIRQHPQHEIGTHTFCHYYCLAEGQTIEQFDTDLETAQKVAGGFLRSIIFPRNQTNQAYLGVCKKYGITSYRGNEKNALNTASAHDGLLKRAMRFMDNYINLTGNNTYTDEEIKVSGEPMNIPASRFLRPYSPKLRILDGFRLRRIKTGMTHAARKGETYHIWWHPHNFGSYTEENFEFLKLIFSHYKYLHNQYNMQSYTMNEMQNLINGERL